MVSFARSYIKRIVLDASVAVAWCFKDKTTGFTEGAGTEVLTPAIWPFEVANAFLVTERRDLARAIIESDRRMAQSPRGQPLSRLSSYDLVFKERSRQ